MAGFDGITINKGGHINYASPPSVQRVSKGLGVVDDPTSWAISQGVRQTGVNTAKHIYFELSLPKGGTLTKVSVFLKGASGHGALPGTPPGNGLPFVSVYLISTVNGTITTLGSLTSDTSPDVASYELIHPINVTMSTVIDSELFRYVADVTTESGTSALSGAKYYAAIATVTPDRISEFEA